MKRLAVTSVYVVGAVAIGAAAYFSIPALPQLEEFADQGEPFYPAFTDPLAAASLEVIDYDETSGTARPFKVQVKDGVWSIPSHYDYPADGADRLATTAAAVIDLRKDIVQSDRLPDHEDLGVIDPLDDMPTLVGRGQRVTLRDAAGQALADFIIGRPVDGKDGFRYVRMPEKKRTYAVKVDVEPSTLFADWIETKLLDVTATDVVQVEINDYSIDESTGRVDLVGNVVLRRDEANAWAIDDVPEGRALDAPKVNGMVNALPAIAITGVRPKPAALTSDLRTTGGLQLDLPTQLSLQSKGFFVSSDGRLLSNEGEVTVGTKAGVRYTLRFGEVFYGDGLSVSAGSDDEPAGEPAGSEHRYLFITASPDLTLVSPKPLPPGPAPEGEEDDPLAATAYAGELAGWEEEVAQARELARTLNDRFAAWYYVISGADFQKVRLSLEKLLAPAEESADDAG